MQITLEVPDAHLGEVLTFIAGLVAKTTTIPDHPELPLTDDGNNFESITPLVGMYYFTRNGAVAKINARHDDSFEGTIKSGDCWNHHQWKMNGECYRGARGYDIIEMTPF